MAPDILASPENWIDPRAPYRKDDLVIPDISHLPTEDDTPLDNFFQAKQQRLLVESLRSSWSGPHNGRPFLVDANVPIYTSLDQPAIAPDIFLSLGVATRDDYTQKDNRCYFVWVFGKVPDVVVEIVSNREDGEGSTKVDRYAQMKVTYYAIFDPFQHLSPDPLRLLVLHEGAYVPLDGAWMRSVELGLRLWHGRFEDTEQTWLRWCDQDRVIIPTGAERARMAEARAAIMSAKLRELGIDPERLK